MSDGSPSAADTAMPASFSASQGVAASATPMPPNPVQAAACYHGEVHGVPLIFVVGTFECDYLIDYLCAEGFMVEVLSSGSHALDRVLHSPLLPDAMLVFSQIQVLATHTNAWWSCIYPPCLSSPGTVITGSTVPLIQTMIVCDHSLLCNLYVFSS